MLLALTSSQADGALARYLELLKEENRDLPNGVQGIVSWFKIQVGLACFASV